ncbi:MAG: hypothetical protein K0R09_3712 [Clostridiales bacterium]|jgi:hypothetical protein|nr:hypothetical protein [Clostridiales bacterium]
MGTNKTVKKFISVNIYDIAGMESWLCDMAAEGLYLKSFGRMFAHFEEGEEKKVRYRLEPVGKGNEMPSEEILEYFQRSGWNYVTQINRLFYIYMAKDDEAEEIHTDPVAQSYTFDILNRKLKNSAILITVLVLFIIVINLGKYMIFKQPMLNMAEGNLVNDLFLIILEGFVMIQNIENVRGINRLFKQLKSGVPIVHKRNYKKGKAIKISVYSLLVLAGVMTIILPFMQIAKSWDKNIEEISVELPTIGLADLEEKENFKYYNEISYSGRDYDNHVFYDWSPIAYIQYEISQRGIVENMMWEDNSGEYKPSLTTRYYQLSLSIFAEPLMEDLISRYIYPYDYMTLEELSLGYFDRAVLATKGEIQYFFAYKENKVICLRYHGYGVLKTKLDEIASMLN